MSVLKIDEMSYEQLLERWRNFKGPATKEFYEIVRRMAEMRKTGYRHPKPVKDCAKCKMRFDRFWLEECKKCSKQLCKACLEQHSC